MPARIVLIDDHEFLRAGLQMRLEQEPGLKVMLNVESVEKALLSRDARGPELVILDLDLPDLSGTDAVHKLKTKWPKAQILILTGMDITGSAQKLLKSGVNGLVCKHESADELILAVHNLLLGKSHLSPAAVTAFTSSFQAEAKVAEIKLTEREREVLLGVAEGLSYKQIADRLKLSVKSIETYRARLAKKLGGATRAHLVRCAVRHGLVKA